MTDDRYIYGGRGYLRFAELTSAVLCAGSECEVRVYRGGPGRVCISVAVPDGFDRSEVDRLAEQVRRKVVVFCQTPIGDFGLDAGETTTEEGRLEHAAFLRTRQGNYDRTVHVPAEHQQDMRPSEVEALKRVVATSKEIRPEVAASIEHCLTPEASDVEGFLANYAVLESVLKGGQRAVDDFILHIEPKCKCVKDSRGKQVTIYTMLRNAKGHFWDMAPEEASRRISALLPKLRKHVTSALF